MFIAHLRAKVEMRRRPHLKERPGVIINRSRGRPTVIDHLPATSGVSVGMAIEEAMSKHASIVVLEADESSYREAFQQILSFLQGIGDHVEGSDLGTAYVRLDGLEKMHGGEERIIDLLLNCLPRDLEAQVGVGSGKFPAFTAARTSRPLTATALSTDAASFLAVHPIDLLPISPDTKEVMHRLGLHKMGDIASMKETDIVDQFGLCGAKAWRLCRGMDNSPLTTLRHEESIVERVSLPFSATSLEPLMAAADILLRRAYSRPQVHGRQAGVVTLFCGSPGGSSWGKVVRFRRGAGRWEDASRIIRVQLEADHPTVPVEEVTLTLADLDGESGAQGQLLPDVKKDREGRLVEMERQLRDRMDGRPALYRLAPIAPWHPAPEMRVIGIPIDHSDRNSVKAFSTPICVAVREGKEHRPAAVRLGERWYQVTDIEDLWSFDLWWMPRPLTRTYYLLRREDGRKVTLFRNDGNGLWYQQAP